LFARLRETAGKVCRVKTKNPEEGNSVVELYVQVGTDDLGKRSLLDMVDQVHPSPIFLFPLPCHKCALLLMR